MRIAYLDCFSGISGDMFLGALLDAGVPAQLLEETVARLDIGARLEISRVLRCGISATKLDVFSHGEKDLPREVYWEQQSRARRHEPGQQHSEHAHAHAHDHEHEPRHQPSPGATAHRPGQGRGLKEIQEIITRSAIGPAAKQTALAVFEALGAAEAKIHNLPVADIHFHELGAVDAMVDIVCAAAGAESLQVEEWVCSPLNVGGGTIVCAHGTFPVPAPATLELLQGAPVYSSGLQAELVTPTGAAIVKTLARRFSAFPPMKITASGYGAGARDFPGHANVLRLTVGEAQLAAEAPGQRETIAVLEAGLDDLNPQLFGYVMERALEEGALEVYGVPLQMKKNRPGMLLTVLARPQDANRLAALLFRETTTLGVRLRQEQRQALPRHWVSVSTPWGNVRLKVATLNGSVANYAPEYEDCRRLAIRHRVPLKSVMQEALRAYLGTAMDKEKNQQHG